MSDSDKYDDELDRFLNDPEFRKRKKQETKSFNLKKPTKSESSDNKVSSVSSFNLKKKEQEAATKLSAFSLKKGSHTSQEQKEEVGDLNENDTIFSDSSTESPQKYRAKKEKYLDQSDKETMASSASISEVETIDRKAIKLKKQIIFANFLKITTAVVLILSAFGAALIFYLSKGLPSIQELENPKTDIASFIKSRDGEILDKYFIQNRTYVNYDNISEHAVNALISTEDHRFYTHWGVDLRGMASVLYEFLTSFDVRGASTITMQLSRNLYKKIGFERSIFRKIREIFTAIQIERNYTKREIIEMYLNTVEFPNSAFGIEAASQTHYGKPAKDLNILESATMIGSLQAVYAYNPRLFPDRAKNRRDVVLYAMNSRGFISSTEYGSLKDQPIVLNYMPPSKAGRKSRYFGEYVRLKMEKWSDDNGYDLYRDGLVIYTTIDSRYQRHAEFALHTKLDTLQKTFEAEWTYPKSNNYMDRLWRTYPLFLDQFIERTNEYKNGFFGYKTRKDVLDSLKRNEAFLDSVMRTSTKLQASFVAIDPTNGHILAWIGGSNFGNVQFDHVYQSKRQSGSTFKPFVYTVAIDNGYPPYTRLSKYPTKFYNRSGKVWAPSDEAIASGPEFVTLRQALARSMNNVTVRLLPVLAGNPKTNKLEDLYPAAKKIVEMAKNLGITSRLNPYPAIALGTAEVSLLEMVSAYTTFANQGVHIDPIAITRIEDKEGNVLAEYFPEYQREVISPETAYIMIDMLRGVVRGVKMEESDKWPIGTGVRLKNVYNVRQDVAGKTGTTQNSADNWFIAMMPHIVMGAWVGGEDRKIRFPTYEGYNGIGQGARTALPIIGEFINRSTDDPNTPWSYEAFEQPKGFIMPEEPKEDPTKQTVRRRINW